MLEIESLSADDKLSSSLPMDKDGDNQSDADTKEDLETALRRKEAEAIYGSDDDVSGPLDASGWEDCFAESNTYTITKLTPGVRDPNRVNVFLDGYFAFSLDIAQVIDLDVKVKQKIDPERLKLLQDASEFSKLYQRTLEWVLTRPHSVRETEDYLKRRKLKRLQLNRQRAREEKKPLPELREDIMAQVVERLIEKGYVNDQKFANFYVENRYVRRGISKKRLRLELRRRGVNEEEAKFALENMDRPEEDEILKVIKKKRKKYNDFMLVSYLVRQGFDFQKAKTAVENYNPDDEQPI